MRVQGPGHRGDRLAFPWYDFQSQHWKGLRQKLDRDQNRPEEGKEGMKNPPSFPFLWKPALAFRCSHGGRHPCGTESLGTIPPGIWAWSASVLGEIKDTKTLFLWIKMFLFMGISLEMVMFPVALYGLGQEIKKEPQLRPLGHSP